MLCPNFKNPQVAQEFKELQDAVGERAAYDIWNQNNGNSIDSSPNGEPSKLFSDLLSHFDGDRELAIKAKAKTFSKSFKTWFGESNVVDENSEPLIETYTEFSDSTDSFKQDNPNIYNSKPLVLKEESNEVYDNIVDTLFPKGLNGAVNSEVLFKILSSANIDASYGPLIRALSNMKVNIEGVITNTSKGMWYNSETNTISIEYDNIGKFKDIHDFAMTYMHEVMHAYTSKALSNPETRQDIAFKTKMEKFYDKFSKSSTRTEYGMTNVHEFVSELMTNPEFRNVLAKSKTTVGSLLTRIIRAIGNLFRNDKQYQLTGSESAAVRKATDIVVRYINYSNVAFGDNTSLTSRNMTGLNPSQEITLASVIKTKADIISGLKSRIKALTHVKGSAIMIDQLNQLVAELNNATEQEAIFKFVLTMPEDTRKAFNYIKKAVDTINAGGVTDISQDDLMRFRKDYIGFYGPMIERINGIDTSFFDGFGTPLERSEFFNMRKILHEDFAVMNSNYNIVLAVKTKDILKGIGVEVNSPTIDNYVANNLLSITGDISSLSRNMTSAGVANDEAVRLVYKVLTDAKSSVDRFAYGVGKDLAVLASKASSTDTFYERDSNGKLTGWFIRDLKYGEFNNNYKALQKELQFKYGITQDDYHADSDLAKAYKRELNNWLSEHCERMYTKEYYDIYNDISTEASVKRNDIQRDIAKLHTTVCDENGDVHRELLSDADFAKLNDLFREKRALALELTSDGVMKSGTDLEIAKELQEVAAKLKDNIKYTQNKAKFDKLCKEKQEQYKDKPELLKKWLDRSTKIEYSSEFWDLMGELDKRDRGHAYTVLENAKSKLLSLYRGPNFQVDMRSSKQARETIRQIDSTLASMRAAQGKGAKVEGLQFKHIAEVLESDIYKEDKKNAEKMGPEGYKAWRDANHYTDESGNVRPNSYYTYLSPKNKEHIQRVPNEMFLELDKESPFYNNNYDDTNSEKLQPKRELYDNKKAYDKMMSKTANEDFYNKMISVMKESNSKISFLGNRSPYFMPQLSGTSFKALKERGLKGVVENTMDKFAVKDDDVDYVTDEILQRADGSKLRFIPTHFVKPLEDPNQISADLVGMLHAYTKMSDNYRAMSELAPTVETVMETLAKREVIKKDGRKQEKITGSESNTYKKLDDFAAMYMYGENKKNNGKVHIKGTDYTLSLAKLTGSIAKYWQVTALGWNQFSAWTGIVSATSSAQSEALSGRFFTHSSYRAAVAELSLNLPGMFTSMGDATSNNKMILMMEHFDISLESRETFNHTNRSQLQRAMGLALSPMGIWQLADITVKAPILLSVLKQTKLIDGKFIPRNQFFAHYKGTRKEAKLVWKTSGKTLQDAFEVKNNRYSVKEEYKAYVDDALLNNVKGLVKKLTAKIDGMVNDADKTRLHCNVFTNLVFMFRGFMITNIQERWLKKRSWDPILQDYDEAQNKAMFKAIGNLLNAQVERFKGEKTKAERQRMVPAYQRAALKKTGYELMFVAAFYAMALAVKEMCDKDKRNMFKEFLAYICCRTWMEQLAGTGLTSDFMSMIKSPASITTMYDNACVLMSGLFGLAVGSDKPGRVIKRGAYKGQTNVARSAWKLTPFKNIIELQDPKSKRNWIENQWLK